MRYRVIGLTILSGLLLAGSVLAKPYDPERSAPQKDYKPRREFSDSERMHFQKHRMHKQMTRQHRHKAMRHHEMAMMHKREFRHERFGPDMRREHRREMRHEMFGGPGMNPDFPKGPPPFARERMQLRQEQFGPGMNPEHPMGPPQHMRFRDGMKHPRAQ